MSAPKPLSVTTQSASLSPIRSAMIELLPCAMLANGPACTKTGVFSVVWSSVGLMVSRSSTAMAPAVPRCLGGDRLAALVEADHDPAEALAEVLEARGEAEDGHDLGRHRDVEARSRAGSRSPRPPRPITIFRSARSLTSTTRGHVMVSGSMRERVAVGDRVVDHRREQVVGERDRVDVAGQVEVEVLHRNDLRIAAARRAALDAEHRPERRLPDGRDGPRPRRG